MFGSTERADKEQEGNGPKDQRATRAMEIFNLISDDEKMRSYDLPLAPAPVIGFRGLSDLITALEVNYKIKSELSDLENQCIHML